MVTVLVNPIDIWLKIIDRDIHDLPIWGFIDKDGNVRAYMIVESPRDSNLRFYVRGESASCAFSSVWEPPDDEIKESPFSFFEELIGKTLNLCYRGEWKNDKVQDFC